MNSAQVNVGVRRPYPGLRPFEPSESDLFFGRGDQIDDLLAKLEDHRFVAVVGASGSGKSSLVRAGLLPSLDAGFLSDTGTDWRMVIMRPGEAPFSRLAVALHESVDADNQQDVAHAAAFTEATLRSGPRGLVEAIGDLGLPRETNILVLVDQFEEIFRFRHRSRSGSPVSDRDVDDRNDATAFVNMLLATTECELTVYIVLTMRSDFLGDCDAFHGLPEAINDCQFLVPRLRRDQIRDTITGPLDLFNARAEAGLVNRILNEIGSDPDQLPLMQHLLLRMWTREEQSRGEPVLTVSDYVAVGGLAYALSRHADEAYEELRDPESKRVAELMFRCLCDRSAEARSTRRLVTVAEVAAVAGVHADKVKEVAQVFLHPDRSFLTMSPLGELTPGTTLDISHEALIRQWTRLSDWVSREARSASIYRRLYETARLWKEGNASLLASPELEIALDWKEHQQPTKAWSDRYGGGFDLSMEFLDASVAEQQAQAERRRREVRRKIVWLVSTLAIVTSLLIVAGILWLGSQSLAAEMKEQFIESQLSLGTASIRNGRMGEGLARYWSAYENTTADHPARETACDLIAAWSRLAGEPMIHDSAVRKVAFTPDGGNVLTVTDQITQFWDPQTKEPRVEKIVASGEPWQAVAVSPDVATVLVAVNTSAQIWDVRTGMPKGQPFAHGEKISNVAFSGDGSVVMTRGEKITQFWKTETAEPISQPWQNKGQVFALNPNGKTFIEADDTGVVIEIDLETDETNSKPDLGPVSRLASRPTTISHRGIRTVVFSRDSEFILTGSADNTARIWNAKSGERIGSSMHHEGTVVTAAFSRYGEKVLTGSADNTARLWDLKTGQPLSSPLRHNGTVVSVGFFTDNDKLTLLTGSVDRTARLWHLRRHESAKRHEFSASYGENGDAISLFTYDDMHYFNATTGGASGSSSSSRGAIRRAAVLSPDKRMVLAAVGNTVYLWNYGTASPQASNTEDDKDVIASLGSPQAEFTHDSKVVAASFGPDERTILTASGRKAQLWNLDDTKKPIKEHMFPDSILAAAISPDPDNQMIVVGGANDVAQLWDINAGVVKRVKQIPLPHDDDVLAVAFSHDGQLVATGSADNTAAIWHVKAGKPLQRVLAHQDAVTDVMFSLDNSTLLTASDDTGVRFWDVDSGQLRGDPLIHPGQVKVARYSHNGEKMFSLDDSGSARSYNVVPPAADEPKRLRLSIEVRWGYHIDEYGMIHRLSQEAWLDRKQRLKDLGGPCDVRSWYDLKAEKDKRAGKNIEP